MTVSLPHSNPETETHNKAKDEGEKVRHGSLFSRDTYSYISGGKFAKKFLRCDSACLRSTVSLIFYFYPHFFEEEERNWIMNYYPFRLLLLSDLFPLVIRQRAIRFLTVSGIIHGRSDPSSQVDNGWYDIDQQFNAIIPSSNFWWSEVDRPRIEQK